jgi:hypothetical protein
MWFVVGRSFTRKILWLCNRYGQLSKVRRTLPGLTTYMSRASEQQQLREVKRSGNVR